MAGLGRLGLKLHPDKTHVVKAKDGFDFLGVHFRLCPVRKKNAKLKHFCALWPSERSLPLTPMVLFGMVIFNFATPRSRNN